jgi:hypothetical protein
MLSSSGKHKPTIKTGKLLVVEQWFLRNKKMSDARKMWPTRIELVLDCLSLYFDKAVKIICPDVDTTQRSIVRGMQHVKKGFTRAVWLDQTTANDPPCV